MDSQKANEVCDNNINPKHCKNSMQRNWYDKYSCQTPTRLKSSCELKKVGKSKIKIQVRSKSLGSKG